MKKIIAALAFFVASHSALAFNIDVSINSPMTGLWDNSATEPGWGAAITQQYGMMFVTMYTYDASGNPVWYVASACPVAANGCTGTLYKVTGGSAPTAPWNAPNKIVAPVGTLTMTFSDVNTGAIAFTIDGVSGSKSIFRNVFATVPASTNPTKNDFLWSFSRSIDPVTGSFSEIAFSIGDSYLSVYCSSNNQFLLTVKTNRVRFKLMWNNLTTLPTILTRGESHGDE